ncbi:UBX domain and SEP domain-containing protein [Strongyloides ratti]|uniref:UBX domain and SEP domain-containing protein n=1 Tax=Strongyloides ratti TaxID=34506 RepID=A0A090L0U7_STRRB|nr:UBX domain and SEP domain-containing protein [Strongyloides ratti]CEF63296.1 UBX domain and SEP domain-containing protein [Strongyloides ratti]
MPRIQGLENLNDEKSDSSDHEDDMKYFVGGGKNSGQAVFGNGPNNNKKNEEKVNALFEQARKAGAEILSSEELEDSNKQGSSRDFSSTTGYRLGGLYSSPSVVKPTESDAQGNNPLIIDINVWTNGFSIGDDGLLRSFDDPENQEFWNAIMHGQIPSEIIKNNTPGREIDVRLHRRTEEYKPPKKAFAGSGYRLGEKVSPIDCENANDDVAKKANAEPALLLAAQKEIKLKDGEKVGRVGIRLPCGQLIKAEVNASHTIGDLRDFVIRAVPSLSFSSWRFITNVPKRSFDDETQTLDEAKIFSGMIMVKFD